MAQNYFVAITICMLMTMATSAHGQTTSDVVRSVPRASIDARLGRGSQYGAFAPLPPSLTDSVHGRVRSAAISKAQGATGKPAKSKKSRMIIGAMVGFGVGSLLGLTVGQEACRGSSKWGCVMLGGGTGAAIGIAIGRR